MKDRREFLKIATAVSGSMLLGGEPLFGEEYKPLSTKQQKMVADIWHRERLRASLALEFSKHFNDDLLTTMGKWSASNRRAVLDEVVNLYNVDLSYTSDAQLLYTTRQLKAMKLGAFPSTVMTNRYDTLKKEGLKSRSEAFLTLAKVAVDSIDEMQRYLGVFANRKKVQENITYLVDGSMGHYWAINQKLINLGVVEGCCRAGNKYCKTPAKYPIAYGIDHLDKDLTLTDEQRHALAHMWSEEKMAHDAFEAVYGLYPHLRLFYNIGHWSEVQHMSAVEELVALYNIDVNDYSNADAHYKPQELRKMGAGDYAISDFEDRYANTLLPYAKKGDIEALKLGCMVEVQDIWDLTGFLGQVGKNKYLEKTFKYLIAGSQSHYWAYHYALIQMGVSNGCCSAGADYCKTADEFPSGSGDGLLAALWNQTNSSIA